jgi:hypothetical protein
VSPANGTTHVGADEIIDAVDTRRGRFDRGRIPANPGVRNQSDAVISTAARHAAAQHSKERRR